jgi:hypothetical protein
MEDKLIVYTDSLGLEWSREDLELAGGKENLEQGYLFRRSKKEIFIKNPTQPLKFQTPIYPLDS